MKAKLTPAQDRVVKAMRDSGEPILFLTPVYSRGSFRALLNKKFISYATAAALLKKGVIQKAQFGYTLTPEWQEEPKEQS